MQKKVKCTRYLVYEGKTFWRTLQKKKKPFGTAKPRINKFFLLVWMITGWVSLNTTLCIYATLLDETVNHVMSPTIVAR